MIRACLFCGGDASGPDHWLTCDGQQGHIEESCTPPDPPSFDGETYDHDRDHQRLHAQLNRVLAAMLAPNSTGETTYHTLADLGHATGDPTPSISARLRDLRKEKFGAYIIERRYVENGLWEYRLLRPVLEVRR